MKPAWDKLIDAYAGSTTALIADVDCTSTGGKEICIEHEVQQVPTLKYGDPAYLQYYTGERDFDTLKKFADENLKPKCSSTNIDLCDDEKKDEIDTCMKMDMAELEAKIKAEETKITDSEKYCETEVHKLQNKYQALLEDKENTTEEVKKSTEFQNLQNQYQALMEAKDKTTEEVTKSDFVLLKSCQTRRSK